MPDDKKGAPRYRCPLCETRYFDMPKDQVMRLAPGQAGQGRQAEPRVLHAAEEGSTCLGREG